ncbi:hypothetical protein AALA22_03410 [Anaerovoracaceae bacterium 41-7]
MNARIMKYIGIVVMLVAHPVGYFFWHFVILGPFAYDVDYPFEVSAVLVGVGMLGFFLIGLSLFVMGVVFERLKK